MPDQKHRNGVSRKVKTCRARAGGSRQPRAVAPSAGRAPVRNAGKLVRRGPAEASHGFRLFQTASWKTSQDVAVGRVLLALAYARGPGDSCSRLLLPRHSSSNAQADEQVEATRALNTGKQFVRAKNLGLSKQRRATRLYNARMI